MHIYSKSNDVKFVYYNSLYNNSSEWNTYFVSKYTIQLSYYSVPYKSFRFYLHEMRYSLLKKLSTQ